MAGWQAVTGPDGRFLWTNAPFEYIVLHVDDAAPGRDIPPFGPGGRGAEVVLKVPAPFRLRGKVVDAETGRPIDRFRLKEGIVWSHDFAPEGADGPPDWSLGRDVTMVGGRYEVGFPAVSPPEEGSNDWLPDQFPLLVVRIEAEGYAPRISPKYQASDGERTYDFALRKHPWITGTVHAADGSPVAGAEVVVAVNGQPAPGIDNGRPAPRLARRRRPDGAGRAVCLREARSGGPDHRPERSRPGRAHDRRAGRRTRRGARALGPGRGTGPGRDGRGSA